jgi:hypothetical protein
LFDPQMGKAELSKYLFPQQPLHYFQRSLSRH